jgi:serine/threonine-protein kinase
MEHIDGDEITAFAKSNPQSVADLFKQSIDAFAYIETSGILHRDIRPSNLLVDKTGTVKLIDFGLGKQSVESTESADSVGMQINHWCNPPAEHGLQSYDRTTEVYYLGKLFERIVIANQIGEFEHSLMLNRMCEHDPCKRMQSFAEIKKSIESDSFKTTAFSVAEKQVYQQFADQIVNGITKIESHAEYRIDVAALTRQLEEIYRTSTLEDYVSKPTRIARTFIDGEYYFRKDWSVRTDTLSGFLGLLKGSNVERANVIVANLCSRMDAVQRYQQDPFTDEVPF